MMTTGLILLALSLLTYASLVGYSIYTLYIRVYRFICHSCLLFMCCFVTDICIIERELSYKQDNSLPVILYKLIT